jgi:hypothetical protein
MGLPNNVSDIIQAVRDGEIGLIDTIMIGDLIVSQLTGLSAPRSISVTRKPIEDGFTITDAAVDIPIELNMEILLANPEYSVEAGINAALTGNLETLTDTWRDKRKELERIQDERELVTIQTHEGSYDNMIIQSIDPIFEVEDNWNAFFCSVTAVQITKVANKSTGGLVDSYEEVYGEL